MNLTGHLLRTDVKRLSGLIVAWLAIVATLTALDIIGPGLASVRAQEALSVIRGLLGLTRSLLLVLLVVLAVQMHPLVGTEAFWMTRPIRPLTLLRTKVVLLWGAVAFVLVLAEVVAMAAYGVSARTMVLIALQTALSETLWLLLVMAGAALTLNLARFAMLCGAIVAALAVFLSASLAIAMATMGDGGPDHVPGPADADGTTALLGMLLVVAATAALLVVQYTTRSRARSVVAGGAGLAIAYIVASLWNVPLMARPSEPPAWTRDGAAIRLVPDWSTLTTTQELSLFGDERMVRMVRARVAVDSLQPFWSAHMTLLGGTVHLPDGTVWTGPARGGSTALGLVGDAQSGAHTAVANLLGVERLLGAGKYDDQATLMLAPVEAFTRTPVVEGRYEGTFRVDLTRYDVVGVVPLQPGAEYHARDHRIALQRIISSDRSGAVFIREAHAIAPYPSPRRAHFEFYLRNARLREAVAGTTAAIATSGSFVNLFIGGAWHVSSAGTDSGFSVRAQQLRFPAYQSQDDESLRLDGAWLADAELVIVRSAVEASVQRTLRADKVSLAATVR
jgi:hypothetical protein